MTEFHSFNPAQHNSNVLKTFELDTPVADGATSEEHAQALKEAALSAGHISAKDFVAVNPHTNEVTKRLSPAEFAEAETARTGGKMKGMAQGLAYRGALSMKQVANLAANHPGAAWALLAGAGGGAALIGGIASHNAANQAANQTKTDIANQIQAQLQQNGAGAASPYGAAPAGYAPPGYGGV